MRIELVQSSFNPTHAHLVTVNDSDRPARLRKKSLGFNVGGELDEDVFELFSGDRIPHREANIAHEQDPGEHVLDPNVKLISVVNLARYYELPQARLVLVRYGAVQPDGVMLRSAWVEFWF